MKAELIRVNAPAWSDFLMRVRHDFHHLPGYTSIAARYEGGEPRALVVRESGGSMLLPLIVRPIDGGGHDATSPYGYPGPLVEGGLDPAFVGRALQAGADLLAAEGMVSLFVRFHPLLSPLPTGVGTLVLRGHTVVADLSRSLDELWQETRRNHRRNINKAIGAGYTVRIDRSIEHFDTFKRLYRQTMGRRFADPYYHFDDEYFDGLLDALGDRLWMGIVEVDGTIAEASLEIETCGIVQDYLAGGDETLHHIRPSTYMIHCIRAWAKGRGNQWLHLGGGLGSKDDSLMQFKIGFSPVRLPYYTLHVVLDEPEYLRLVSERQPGADPTSHDGFFPAYRREIRPIDRNPTDSPS